MLLTPILIFIASVILISRDGTFGLINYMVFPFLWVFLLVAFVFRPLGKELGWSGFLLQRMWKRDSFFITSILIVVIWTFWHKPLFWAQEGTSISGLPVTFYSVSTYLIFLNGMSLLITWVFQNAKGSVFLGILIHASSNESGLTLSYLFPKMAKKKLSGRLKFGF